MSEVHAIPAFRDNYLWLLVGEGRPPPVVMIDPGDPVPVIQTLRRHGLTPTAIFVTHHHHDHIGGIEALCARYELAVYGPAGERIPHLTHPMRQNDRVSLEGLAPFTVLDVPGHTAGHIAYFDGRSLFCGDTLFAGGCGRLFEGTAAQMYASLTAIASLPGDTIVYCAHEYTLSNLRFALHVEPENGALQARYEEAMVLRQRGEPTVPSMLALEKATNPFLRCHIPAIVAAASRHAGKDLGPGIETFATLRGWKDSWNG